MSVTGRQEFSHVPVPLDNAYQWSSMCDERRKLETDTAIGMQSLDAKTLSAASNRRSAGLSEFQLTLQDAWNRELKDVRVCTLAAAYG